MTVSRVVLLLFSALFLVQGNSEIHKWDLAVAIDDQIELLTSNGTVIGSAVQFQFSKLKALTFDILRHQFVMSDMEKENDTIYAVRLTKEKPITPIVEDLPDDIQGLAIDAVTDILYFSDSIKRSINHISLNDPQYKSNIFMEFDEQQPQDLAIDACRRYIYWTNSNLQKPTIERASLDAKEHQVLVTEDLFKPVGVTVDYIDHRVYWTDMGEGIYYRIESVDFTGENRRLLFEGTHQTPFAIAVDKTAIFWTDMNNNALWRMAKPTGNEQATPQILKRFSDKPRGLVSRGMEFQISEECKGTLQQIKADLNESSTEYFDVVTEKEVFVECLNFGEPVVGGCKCRRGYSGNRCETSLCHNYCLHGSCDFSSSGYPICRCIPGYRGNRCEHRICEDFCLNGGSCVIDSSHFHGIRCDCPMGYLGQRCESPTNPNHMCEVFCSSGGENRDVLWNQAGTFMCRCTEDTKYILYDNINMTALDMAQASASLTAMSHQQGEFGSRIQDPLFVVVLFCMAMMLLLIIVLSLLVCKLRRRPRIKKRIIVNKNITPLTYRPNVQPDQQQCEITIENCCNMNVCETPCFEPPNLRVFQASKKDEKKVLLSNMENGSDDLY